MSKTLRVEVEPEGAPYINEALSSCATKLRGEADLAELDNPEMAVLLRDQATAVEDGLKNLADKLARMERLATMQDIEIRPDPTRLRDEGFLIIADLREVFGVESNLEAQRMVQNKLLLQGPDHVRAREITEWRSNTEKFVAATEAVWAIERVKWAIDVIGTDRMPAAMVETPT